MKKKIIIIAISVIILAMTIASATTAYFTDTDVAVNEFTVGNVDITLTETNANYDGTPIYDDNDDGVYEFGRLYPGRTYTKTAVIENTGTEDAYLAARITLESAGLDNRFLTNEGTIQRPALKLLCATVLRCFKRKICNAFPQTVAVGEMNAITYNVFMQDLSYVQGVFIYLFSAFHVGQNPIRVQIFAGLIKSGHKPIDLHLGAFCPGQSVQPQVAADCRIEAFRDTGQSFQPQVAAVSFFNHLVKLFKCVLHCFHSFLMCLTSSVYRFLTIILCCRSRITVHSHAFRPCFASTTLCSLVGVAFFWATWLPPYLYSFTNARISCVVLPSALRSCRISKSKTLFSSYKSS